MTPPRRCWTFLFTPLAVALLLGSAAPAQPQQRGAPDLKIFDQAGISFPERLGNFARAAMGSVEPERLDAHYIWRQGGPGAPAVDIYLARVSLPLAQEFIETEKAINVIFDELKPLRDLPAPSAAPRALGRVWKGRLSGRPVVTIMSIDHRNGWRIKIRGTVSEAFGESGPAEIERLVNEFSWWGSQPNQSI